MRCKICYIEDNVKCDCYYRVGGWDEHEKIGKVLDMVKAIRKEKDEELRKGLR